MDRKKKSRNTIAKGGGEGRKGEEEERVPSIRLTGEEKWRLVLGKVWVDKKRHAFLTQSITQPPDIHTYIHTYVHTV